MRGWWQRWPDANIGIAMGGPGRLVALDIDGELGRSTLARLEAEHGELPATLAIRSGREDGGEHRIFRVPDDLDIDAIPNRVGKPTSATPGIDVRAEGGQIVAPPSLHYTGRRYSWVNPAAPIAELPRWLFEIITQRPETQAAERPAGPQSVPYHQRVQRAAAYLERIPGAVSGQRGHADTFMAAQKIGRGFDLDESTTYALMRDSFNPRCQPPWTERDLRRKVNEAFTKGTMAWGELLRAGDHQPRESRPRPPYHERPAPAPAVTPSNPPPAAPEDNVPYPVPDPELSPRPLAKRVPIVVEEADLHVAVDAGCAAMRSDPALFQRDGQLVRVLRSEERKTKWVKDTPAIRPLVTATLRERLTRVALWQKFDARKKGDGLRNICPPDRVVTAIAERGEWRGIRDLVGLLEAPSLRPDGSVIQERGYDEETGYLYLPNDEFERAPEFPTQRDANDALRQLCEVWCDFPFAVEAARYVPIAALLTLLARPAIEGSVPGFIFDAATRATGKTLCSDAVIALATGRIGAKMSYPNDAIELEKVLGAYALRGAAIINFDNVTGMFGSGPLDRCLTASDRVELRVLGRSEVPSMAWRSVIFANGNNVVINDDTTRRVLHCRMESPLERPEDRQDFKHPKLVAWAKSERPRLVRAALTILRAYIAAGKPEVNVASWGSFESWSSLVPSAIVYAGGEDVLRVRPSHSDDADSETGALRVLLTLLPRLSDKGISAKGIVQALYPNDRQNRPPDGFEELREAIENIVATRPGQPPSHRALARRLVSFKGRVIGGRRLVPAPQSNRVRLWCVDDLGASRGNVHQLPAGASAAAAAH